MQLYERTDSLGTAASVELTEAVRLKVLQKLSICWLTYWLLLQLGNASSLGDATGNDERVLVSDGGTSLS